MFLKVEPESLKFGGAQGVERVTVQNTSEENVIYKVKTTAPDVYCVRPNVHTVKPGEKLELEFVYLGRDRSREPKRGDKFLIVTVPVGSEYYDKAVLETDWESVAAQYKARAVSKKIPVQVDNSASARKLLIAMILVVITAYIIHRCRKS